MTLIVESPASFTVSRTAGAVRLPVHQALLTGHRPSTRRHLSLQHYDQSGNQTPLPTWAGDAEQQLQLLVELPRGWDGRRAEPVTELAVKTVVLVLAEVMAGGTPSPQYFPLPDGGLQVEWHAGGHDIEVEVEGDGSLHVLSAEPEGTAVDAELAAASPDSPVLTDLRTALERLTDRVAAAR